jgi:hypothetical protein
MPMRRGMRATWAMRLAVVLVAVAAYVWALPAAFGGDDSSSSSSYTYGPLVTICHKGVTITVNESGLPPHLSHGDTIGPCR